MDDAREVVETPFLAGQLRLRQPARGHKAGTDAVLLAASAAVEPGEEIADIGSGVGTVGLAIAKRDGAITARLIERDPSIAALARDNVVLNDLAARVRVEEADLFAAERWPSPIASMVVSNPPFYAAGSVRSSPDPRKASAHTLGKAGHGDWLRAMLRLLQPHGRLVLIHTPAALPSLLAAAEGRLGGLQVMPVLPRHGEPAIRILLGGTVGSRAPFAIRPPLVLHDPSGGFTPQADALHRGQGLLSLLEPSKRKSRPRGPALSSASA